MFNFKFFNYSLPTAYYQLLTPTGAANIIPTSLRASHLFVSLPQRLKQMCEVK